MHITEKLSGSQQCQEAISRVQRELRVTVTRKLDKPGQWLVIDKEGERIGFLTAASSVAKRLNAGEHLVHASVYSISEPNIGVPRSTVQVRFLLGKG